MNNPAYKVSRHPNPSSLPVGVGTKEKSIPLVTIKSPPKNIKIPSVNQEGNNAFAYEDDIALDSLPGTANIDNRGSRKGTHSLTHPVKGMNQNEIRVELESPLIPPPSATKLDILEAHLPKNLRSHRKSIQRLKIDGDQRVVFDMLQTADPAKAAEQSQTSLSIDSYKPKHFSSGAWSRGGSLSSLDHHAHHGYQQGHQHHEDDVGSQHSDGSSVGSSLSGNVHHHHHHHHQHHQQDIPSHGRPLSGFSTGTTSKKLDHDGIAAKFHQPQQHQMHHSQSLGAGMASLLIDDKQKRIDPAKSSSLWASDPTTSMQVRENVMLKAKSVEEVAHSDAVHDAVEQQIKRAKKGRISRLKLMNTLFVEQVKMEESIDQAASHFRTLGRRKRKERVSDYALMNENLALHVGEAETEKLHEEEEYDKELLAAERKPFAQRIVAVHKDSDGETDADAANKLKKSAKSMRQGMEDLQSSKIKLKLKTLATYINSHTSRKMLDAWYSIEARFRSSTHHKQVIEVDEGGLAHPVKHPAIPLSAMVYLLCSSKIKVGHEEISKLCMALEDVKKEHIFTARQVAAIQVVMGMGEEKSPEHDKLQKELFHLVAKGEPLVSLQELTDLTFSQVPEEREIQFRHIAMQRTNVVQQMLDDKKKKEELRAKAASRKKKMIEDFELALSHHQYMKGVFTTARCDEFIEMVHRSQEYIAKQKEDALTNIPQELILFLGLDAFPKDLQAKIELKNQRRRQSHRPSDVSVDRAKNPFIRANIEKGVSLENKPVILPIKELVVDSPVAEEEETNAAITITSPSGKVMIRKRAIPNVQLSGPPVIVATLREMVSFGRGLQGMTYRDAVAALQWLAATKIAKQFRCFKRRWRYNAARKKWREVFLGIMRVNMSAFAVLTRHNINTRNLCWRKMKAWQFYTHRAHQRRHIFRVCFWPFYVWHKYADSRGKARDKATFLTGRVMPTLLTISVFKAWKGWAQIEGNLNRSADAFFALVLRRKAKEWFQWYRWWAHKRSRIRRAWVREGHAKRQLYIARLVVSPFYMWRSFVNYRRHLRERIRIYMHAMRRRIFDGVKPRQTINNSQRRVQMKLSEKKKRKQTRKVSKTELKNKLKKRAKDRRKTGDGEDSDDEDSSAAASRKSGKSSRSGKSGRQSLYGEAALDFTDKIDKMFDREFHWGKDVRQDFDILDNRDEEGDGSDGLLPFITQCYEDAQIDTVPNPDDLLSDFFPRKLDSRLRKQVLALHTCYEYTDHWNLFEAAFRFQNYAHRAFSNLREWAVSRRRVNEFVRTRHTRIKQIIMNEFRHSIEVRKVRNLAARGSEAEKLTLNVREHQLMKINRTRKFTNEVNQALGRDHDDEEDETEARKQRMKMLNLIDPDDEAYIEKEKKRIEERHAEQKRKREERDRRYKPPNLLEIDRSDRNVEQKQAEDMVEFGRKTREEAVNHIALADAQSEAFRNKAADVHSMVLEVLDSESAVTTRAIDRQDVYMQEFRVHAADNLITALAKVYAEVQLSLMKEESKVYFRCLRLPMLLQRSKAMYNRKKLMNWIRICRRLNAISRNAHFYHNRRMAWVTFNRWLKFIAVERLNPTPGLVPMVIRRAQLIPDYESHLKDEQFAKSVYVDNTRLKITAHEFRVVFSRWKMLTQEEKLFGVLNAKAVELFQLRLKQKCFWALKTGADVQEFMPIIRSDPTIFPVVRLLADFDQIAKRFLVVRKASLTTVVRKYNRKYTKFVKKDGQTSLSFKSFNADFQNQTSARISTEQRMISDYFDTRGTQIFDDVEAPEKTHPLVPPIMSRVVGKEFRDPHSIAQDGRTVTVPGGYRLAKVKFAFQHGLGVIGWQLVWSADGARDIESPQRGTWHAASLSACEFQIPKDDFVVGMEYLYDNAVIVGIRLKLFLAGFTKWVGGKTSLSTLSVYLDASVAPRLDYEDERDAQIPDAEKEDPAFPYSFVIGFTGVVSHGKATRIGLVVRKIRQQHIFSYIWVGDAMWKLEAERTEDAAGVTLPSIDMHSIPTHLSPVGRPGASAATAAAVTTKEGVSGKLNEEGSMKLDAKDSLLTANSNTSAAMRLSQKISNSAAAGPGSPPAMSSKNPQFDIDEESSMDSGFDDQSSSMQQSSVVEDNTSIKSGMTKSTKDGGGSAAPPSPDIEAKNRVKSRRGGISNAATPGLVDLPPQKSEGSQLTSSEVQFFDLLRMRTTELAQARYRCLEFARKLWTDKDLRLHPQYSKLAVIRIVSGLTKWLFQGLSKRLMPDCVTEKSALKLLRHSRQLLARADNTRIRATQILMNADVRENSGAIWRGKSLLSPAERAAKAEHYKIIAFMRQEAAKVKRDETMLRLQAVIEEKRAKQQLPKLPMSQYIMNNYRLKLSAARHKESLLERMSLEEVKAGLFGSNLKEKLLNKGQMRAIHDSLRSQQLVLKDTTSLERLIDETIIEEGVSHQFETSVKVASAPKSQGRIRQTRLSALPNVFAGSNKTSAKLDRHTVAAGGAAGTGALPMIIDDEGSLTSSTNTAPSKSGLVRKRNVKVHATETQKALQLRLNNNAVRIQTPPTATGTGPLPMTDRITTPDRTDLRTGSRGYTTVEFNPNLLPLDFPQSQQSSPPRSGSGSKSRQRGKRAATSASALALSDPSVSNDSRTASHSPQHKNRGSSSNSSSNQANASSPARTSSSPDRKHAPSAATRMRQQRLATAAAAGVGVASAESMNMMMMSHNAAQRRHSPARRSVSPTSLVLMAPPSNDTAGVITADFGANEIPDARFGHSTQGAISSHGGRNLSTIKASTSGF